MAQNAQKALCVTDIFRSCTLCYRVFLMQYHRFAAEPTCRQPFRKLSFETAYTPSYVIVVQSMEPKITEM